MLQYLFRMFSGAKSAKLLKKTVLVTPDEATSRLKVISLTFQTPVGSTALGVRMDHGDVVKVMIPNYKPKSYSMSAERHGEFDLTIKVYPNGRCSGYLDRIKVGECIHVFPRGNNQRSTPGLVGLVAFGVGITEALPLAEAELAKGDAHQVTLLWALRNREDEFWKDRIVALYAQYGTRFKLVRIFSRDDAPADDRGMCLQGRISAEVLRHVFEEGWEIGEGGKHGSMRDSVRFVTVGTKPMMRDANIMLSAIGFPMPTHALLRRPDNGSL